MKRLFILLAALISLLASPVQATSPLQVLETGIRALPYEAAIFYDPATYQEVARFRGTRQQVSIPTNQWRRLHGLGMLHNHPGGSDLSTDDLYLAYWFNLSEIRVVTADRLCSMYRDARRFWPMPTPDFWRDMGIRMTAAQYAADNGLRYGCAAG